jgi:transposase
MAPLRGWSRRGQRLSAHLPHGHWKTLTFVAALRHDRIDAPCVFDGPINGRCFTAYVEQVLAPTLRPGDVVILDNLGSHKGCAVREAIRAAGARLIFLPPYSPDLNPIEQVFAKLKHLMRQAQERTVEAAFTSQSLGAPPAGPGAHGRGGLETHRRASRPLHARGMPELPRQRRIRFKLITSGSRACHSQFRGNSISSCFNRSPPSSSRGRIPGAEAHAAQLHTGCFPGAANKSS